MHLSFAVDAPYVPHAAAMLRSVLERRAPGSTGVLLLHGPGLPSADLDALLGLAEHLGAQTDSREIDDAALEGIPTEGFTGKASWYRAFLPDLVPSIDRTLYLDADTVALEPLDELWDTALDGCSVAAVTNVFEPWHAGRPAELGLQEFGYFNAGVLLLDLAAMRRDGSGAEVLRYGREHADELVWRDQDALNAVLGPRRLALHPRWNVMNSVLHFPAARAVFGSEALAEARRRPAIRHFEGPSLNKPWHYLADRRDQALYRRHRRCTPWPDVELVDRTPATVVLRPLPRRLRVRGYVELLRWRERRAR